MYLPIHPPKVFQSLYYYGFLHDSKIDQNGRYIILDISLFDQRLTFVSLYGYNSDEPEMFNEENKQLRYFSLLPNQKHHFFLKKDPYSLRGL
jgi:hypothetical protein